MIWVSLFSEVRRDAELFGVHAQVKVTWRARICALLKGPKPVQLEGACCDCATKHYSTPVSRMARIEYFEHSLFLAALVAA